MVKIPAGVLAAVLVIYGLVSFTQQAKIDALEKSKEKGKINWFVEMAKAKGQTEVLVGSSFVDYAVSRNLEEALANHDLILAEAVSSQSFPETVDIWTWHKFRLIETLSTHTVDCFTCPAPSSAPPEMLPVDTGEFLISQLGGEVLIDGVKLVSKNPQFPQFERGKRYLLFVAFDQSRMVAVAPMGPWGTFVTAPDEKLRPVDNKLIHGLRRDLSDRFNDSLTSLRTHFKKNFHQN